MTTIKTRYSILIFLTWSLVLWTSCEEVIELDGARPQGELVINGSLNNSDGPHTIKVSRVVSVDENPIPVEGATVRVFDSAGSSEMAEENIAGTYIVRGGILCGVPGETYHLEVELLTGETYRSIPETMPLLNASDTSYAVAEEVEFLSTEGITVTRTVIRVYTNTKLPVQSDPFFLKWDVHDVFTFQTAALPAFKYPRYSQSTCYFIEDRDPQQINLFSEQELQITEIEEQITAEAEIDVKFYNTHYFNVVQSSLTFEAHRYWEQINAVSNSSGSLFDLPPSKVRGNIFNVNDASEEVLGYFQVSKMDTSRARISRSDIPVLFITDPCELPNILIINSFPFECFECLAPFLDPECYISCTFFDPEKVIERPSYFDD